jgi:cob(I)alamin adenosyltransferase
MVYLNRIYTRGGDAGETSLGDGSRVPKTHPRIVAYGGADELGAVLGLCLAEGIPDPYADWLRTIQNVLFDLSADLCIPEGTDTGEPPPLRGTAAQSERLEDWIASVPDQLEPLTSFILPGGTSSAAWLHLARTVCRRVEIGVLALAAETDINPQVCIYLNRLSDLLFVLGRMCNDGGKADILWQPGQNRGGE